MQAKRNSKLHFPATYREFVKRFVDNEACLNNLEKLKWSMHFNFHKCKSTDEPWVQTSGRLVCAACRHQTTVVAGTIFEKTRTPLMTWFKAAWYLTTAKNGCQLRQWNGLLVLCYRTPWTMLQRFRVAMVRAERSKLTGKVEIYETFSGGVKVEGKRGRGSEKLIIAIAVEIKELKGFGRVRIRCIPDASEASISVFIKDSVSENAEIHTDGWKG